MKKFFSKIIKDLELKILIIFLSIKRKEHFSTEYKRLTKIRKSKLNHLIKRVMILNPIPSYFNNIKSNLNTGLPDKVKRIKEIMGYCEELSKPHIESAGGFGCSGNSSPIFYDPEIVSIHNESLKDKIGPDLVTLIHQETALASMSLKQQSKKLDRLNIISKNEIGKVAILNVKKTDLPILDITIDKNETMESFKKKMLIEYFEKLKNNTIYKSPE